MYTAAWSTQKFPNCDINYISQTISDLITRRVHSSAPNKSHLDLLNLKEFLLLPRSSSKAAKGACSACMQQKQQRRHGDWALQPAVRRRGR